MATSVRRPSATISPSPFATQELALSTKSSWDATASAGQTLQRLRHFLQLENTEDDSCEITAPFSPRSIGPELPRSSEAAHGSTTDRYAHGTLNPSSPLGVDQGFGGTSYYMLEKELNDETMSIQSEDLENLRWPGLGSDNADNSSVYPEEEQTEREETYPWQTWREPTSEREAGGRGSSPYAHAAMSRRADLILANAKRRLNLLEGNLRRTRNSFLTPQPSLSTLTSTSSDGENISTASSSSDQSRNLSKRSTSSGRRRNVHAKSPSSPGSDGYLHYASEITTPDGRPSYTTRTGSSPREERPATAMGSMDISSYPDALSRRRAIRTSRSDDSMLRDEYRASHAKSNLSGHFGLTPLMEDETTSIDASTWKSGEEALLQSASSRNTNTLREQMNELKSRIHTIQKRARDDSLRRRSLQGLREVAAAQTHYGEARDYARENVAETVTPYMSSEEYVRTGRAISDYEHADEGDSVYEEALDVRTLPTIEERHEDRADAFDYERIFLHSGMGIYSRPNQIRRNSALSTDSVETARGPTSTSQGSVDASPSPQRPVSRYSRSHSRRYSGASVSTLASFATALFVQDSPAGFRRRAWRDSNEPLADRTDHRPDTLRLQSPESGLSSPSQTSTPPLTLYPSGPESFPGSKYSFLSDQNLSSHFPQPQRPASLLFSSLLGPATKINFTTALRSQDKDLVYALAESLQQVCVQLQLHHENPYESRVWRRRLFEATQVLDGEVEADYA